MVAIGRFEDAVHGDAPHRGGGDDDVGGGQADGAGHGSDLHADSLHEGGLHAGGLHGTRLHGGGSQTEVDTRPGCGMVEVRWGTDTQKAILRQRCCAGAGREGGGGGGKRVVVRV